MELRAGAEAAADGDDSCAVAAVAIAARADHHCSAAAAAAGVNGAAVSKPVWTLLASQRRACWLLEEGESRVAHSAED